MTSGRLSLVATPIGNLADASARMQEVLAAADVVLAEDTRRSGRLLLQIGVEAKLLAFHEHNERELTESMLRRLHDGDHLALVSDAGTPTLSDPGFRLVRAAHAADIRVESIPGASAITVALSASGLPTDRFCFEGFLPPREAARIARLESLRFESRTLVFFESVHRVEEMLQSLEQVFGGDRIACIARELTKRHEQITTTAVSELRERVATGAITLKGEFVVIVQGATDQGSEVSVDPEDLLVKLLKAGVGVKTAASTVAEVTGQSRNAWYQKALDATE